MEQEKIDATVKKAKEELGAEINQDKNTLV